VWCQGKLFANQLQALAMNEDYRWKKKLFSEQGRAQLEKLTLAPWASRRRQELLELLDRMNPTIEELTAAVAEVQEEQGRPLVGVNGEVCSKRI
jgi:transposase